MRIWDLPPERLCRKHLLGEHMELHAIWSILTMGHRGYSNHPETLRWKGKLRALYELHQKIAAEMARRGYRHRSPLDRSLARGAAIQSDFVDTPGKQARILMEKGCGCRVGGILESLEV